MLRLALAATLLLALLGLPARAEIWTPHVREVADFLIAQQTPQGCIPDVPGGLRANTDSAMEYALLAMAQAYRATATDRFRRGLHDGLQWLAASMEKQDREWTGSWRYAYSAKPPYLALPTSPGGEVEDARGVSATSALFVYLLGLYSETTGDASFAKAHQPHARAALDFILDHNLGPNDLFWSGWHRAKGSTEWKLYRMQYAPDQADVYLGLIAGYRLTGLSRYKRAADRLADHVPRIFFDRDRRAFGTALDESGRLTPPNESWEGHFAQGYLAWVFGPMSETRDAMRWLQQRQAPDGSFRLKKSDPAYALSAAVFCLGASRCALYANHVRQAKRWLRDAAVTDKGGVRDTAAPKAPIHNNLAGWVTAAWRESDPFMRKRDDAEDMP